MRGKVFYMKRKLAIFAMSVMAMNGQSVGSFPGDPLAGLTAEDLRLFEEARKEFTKGYTGSAPTSRADPPCSSCHLPPEMWAVTYDSGPLMNGGGLLEGIPDELILQLEQRTDGLALGIRGRASRVADSATGRARVGRFGWRAQYATLLDASAASMASHVGIPESVSRNQTPDPVTGLRRLDVLAAFPRFLAAVGPAGGPAAAPPVFNQIGCALCHTPGLTAAAPGTLGNVSIQPYSDLLLHDVGTGGEIRTTPLWGLRLRRRLLHDGSARSIAEAIRAHGGTATVVRQRFSALSAPDVEALLDFLSRL